MDLCRFINPNNHHHKIDLVSLDKNTEIKIKIISLCDDLYYDLLISLLDSIKKHTYNNHNIIIYDIGLSGNNKQQLSTTYDNIIIKSIDRHKNVYISKIEAMYNEYNKIDDNEIMIYMDSACKILGPLYRLINYINKYNFFAGVTSTPVSDWFSWSKYGRKFYENTKHKYMDYNKEYSDYNLTGIEGGFIGIKKGKQWIDDFFNILIELKNTDIKAYDDFPHDQKIMAYILDHLVYRKYKHDNIILYNSPNVRFEWIHKKIKAIGKENCVAYDPKISIIPFFEYCYHNHVDSENIVPNRRLKYI